MTSSPQTAAGDVSSPRLSVLEVVAANVVPFLHIYEVRSLLLTSKSLADTVSSIFRKDANAVHHLRKSSPPPSVVDVFARGDLVAADIQCLHFYELGASIAEYGAISRACVAELNTIATEMVLKFNGIPRPAWSRIDQEDFRRAWREQLPPQSFPWEFVLSGFCPDYPVDERSFHDKIKAVLKSNGNGAPDGVDNNRGFWFADIIFWPGTHFNYAGCASWLKGVWSLEKLRFLIGGCVRGAILFVLCWGRY